MKRFLIGLSILAAACSGSNPAAPSSVSSGAQSSQATSDPSSVPVSPTVDPAPPVPGANAATPQFTLSGPRDPFNCFTAGTAPMQWILNVSDAGPKELRFVAVAQHDDAPGCESTERDPRNRVSIGGVTDYTPHSSGQTTFAFDPKLYTCGRVQVDVSIFDAAGHEILIVGVVINYGTTCAPPPPGTLVCQPASQNALAGQPVTFSATGGSGSYSWSSPSGSPSAGNSASFTTSYAAAGAFSATVTSGGATATCQVTIKPSVTTEFQCTPSTQDRSVGEMIWFKAAGGTGSYAWSAPGGSSSTGSGDSFSTSYSTDGTKSVTVTSGELTRSCQVVIQPPPPPRKTLACGPPSQTVLIGQAVIVSAVGGNGSYTWSAPASATPTGSGGSFTTSYTASGTNTILVRSGDETAACQVVVPPLACSPVVQTVEIGASAALTATGGTGSYSWSAPDSLNESGTGSTFTTQYLMPGTNAITLTSGSASVSCSVNTVCPTRTHPSLSGTTPMFVPVCPAQ